MFLGLFNSGLDYHAIYLETCIFSTSYYEGVLLITTWLFDWFVEANQTQFICYCSLGAFDSAKNHKRQHRKRQSVTA